MLQKSTGSDEEKSVTRIDWLTKHRVCFKTNRVQDIRYDVEAHLHIVLQYGHFVLYVLVCTIQYDHIQCNMIIQYSMTYTVYCMYNTI